LRGEVTELLPCAGGEDFGEAAYVVDKRSYRQLGARSGRVHRIILDGREKMTHAISSRVQVWVGHWLSFPDTTSRRIYPWPSCRILSRVPAVQLTVLSVALHQDGITKVPGTAQRQVIRGATVLA
jgi:hypothetical protein